MAHNFHTYFFKQSKFEAPEAPQKPSGTKKSKSRSFHQYSWNSEVETTWISLIGWHHKTSNKYLLRDYFKGLTREQTRQDTPFSFGSFLGVDFMDNGTSILKKSNNGAKAKLKLNFSNMTSFFFPEWPHYGMFHVFTIITCLLSSWKL